MLTSFAVEDFLWDFPAIYSLQVTRLHPCKSTQALFPLPVPKLGIFRNYKCGSRERRRRAFYRAFHVCVMAFNFWHSDYKRIPLSSMDHLPSDAQRTTLDNMRRMLRAFGSSEAEFSVPKSGRRITSLVSGDEEAMGFRGPLWCTPVLPASLKEIMSELNLPQKVTGTTSTLEGYWIRKVSSALDSPMLVIR